MSDGCVTRQADEEKLLRYVARLARARLRRHGIVLDGKMPAKRVRDVEAELDCLLQDWEADDEQR